MEEDGDEEEERQVKEDDHEDEDVDEEDEENDAPDEEPEKTYLDKTNPHAFSRSTGWLADWLAD